MAARCRWCESRQSVHLPRCQCVGAQITGRCGPGSQCEQEYAAIQAANKHQRGQYAEAAAEALLAVRHWFGDTNLFDNLLSPWLKHVHMRPVAPSPRGLVYFPPDTSTWAANCCTACYRLPSSITYHHTGHHTLGHSRYWVACAACTRGAWVCYPHLCFLERAHHSLQIVVGESLYTANFCLSCLYGVVQTDE